MAIVFLSILIFPCLTFVLLYILYRIIKKNRESVSVEKPKNILLAVNLFWISITMGLIASLITELTHTPAKPLSSFAKIAIVFIIAESFVFSGTSLAIINLKISAGKNWARVTLLVLILCQNITIAFQLQNKGLAMFKGSVTGEMLWLTQSALEAYILFLIFTKPGSEWFRKDKQI